jgi:GT2 family glycosyltransferase
MNQTTSSRAMAVLIVAYRSAEKLELCLRSAARYLPEHQVHVWDNSGPDYPGVCRLSETMPGVHWYLGSENIGFAAAVNRLAAAVPAYDMLLLNPDAELVGTLTSTLNSLREPGIAAVAPMTEEEPASKASRFSRGPRPWDVAHRRLTLLNTLCSAAGMSERLRGTFASPLYRSEPKEVDGYLTGACIAIRRDAWDAVGPFDEEFFLYGEEADWQRRAMSAGWRVLLQDEVGVRHSAMGTVTGDPTASTRSRDLLRANMALLLEYGHGSCTAEMYLAGTSLVETVKRKLRRSVDLNQTSSDFLITVDGPDSAETDQRILAAKALAADGYAVTVVSLQRLGRLPREVPTSIRLLRRPWWWPMTSPHAAPAVLITGTTRRQRLLASLFRLGRKGICIDADAALGKTADAKNRPETPPVALKWND